MEELPRLNQLGRSLTNLFTKCATPAGQVVVLSIDDITSGDGEFLLNTSYKQGGPIAMLKWAKGSKNGGPGHHGSTSRVSLADLRRASAKLLRRKDSTNKSKASTSTVVVASSSPAPNIAIMDDDSPPPMVPPRGSSATPTARHHQQGVIKQATVRRMSTLRHQKRSTSPTQDKGGRTASGRFQRGSTSTASSTSTSSSGSSTSSSSSTSHRINRARRAKSRTDGDNSSSLYMQLDKIPVAVQAQLLSSKSKRKALEDISNNQAYRLIINSLQDELARLADSEDEDEDDEDDETRTLAEATLLPMNQMEVNGGSVIGNGRRSCRETTVTTAEVKEGTNRVDDNAVELTASFTSQPPTSDSLPRPRAVRHPSPNPGSNETEKRNSRSTNDRSVAAGIPYTPSATASDKSALRHHAKEPSVIPNSPMVRTAKSKTTKSVTFKTEARLICEQYVKLPVVFEADQEDPVVRNACEDDLMPGFVNVPCSRRGFCMELLPSLMAEKLIDSSCELEERADGPLVSPDGGYDWQPSYVNLDDAEIAPVLMASSRSADDSSDFWKPKSVGQRNKTVSTQQEQPGDQPVYDSPTVNVGDSMADHPILADFPGFRYGIHQLPAGMNGVVGGLERRSISNGSSGSDTQDSGVAEMAHQPLSLSRAASASPQLATVGSRRSLADDVLAVQPFVYNTLPRTDKRSHYNFWQEQQQQSTQLCPSIYSTTDPHYLSAIGSAHPQELSSASVSTAIDPHDSSWSSDHLYCNMASVDPLPSLPPRISRRCHSLLALASPASKTNATNSSTAEVLDADYENLHATQLELSQRFNISHGRSRSLRHSGDFGSCWLPLHQLQSGLQQSTPSKAVETKESPPQPRVSSRRQQLLYERARRLELMLNDASMNDYSDTYEPSDWSMQATLSDTARDVVDGSSSSDHYGETRDCHHCCCRKQKRHHRTSRTSVQSQQTSPLVRIRENAATQTEQTASPLARTLAAAENPLYMAYNDLTKIDDYDSSADVKKTPLTASVGVGHEDYASDGCETWNSHKHLYARLQAARKRDEEILAQKASGKSRSKRPPATVTPSNSRIWRHGGQTVSTPQKGRRGGRRKSRSEYQSINTTANSTTLDRTALSTRSARSTKSQRSRHRKGRKPKAADVLHGKGQLQLAIYLNSGLLTLHVQSARNLKSPGGRPCNSYVKISLIPDDAEQTFCRTTLVKNDNNPWYDQKFSFEFLSADLYKRLLISVWNRCPRKNRSEFMGCMSFSVAHVIRKDASGWYRLLNGNIGRQRHFAVRKNIDLNNSTIVPTDQDMEEDLVVVDDSENEQQQCDDSEKPARTNSMTTVSVQSNGSAASIQQAVQHLSGKTPYTTTVTLKRTPKGSFGFSVTWTHPPRIERVEPGSAADLAGMRVADYIVFVGSHNVVKMEEDRVLQLIQSAGDVLMLEVYRKSNKSPAEQLTLADLKPGSSTGSPVPVNHHQQQPCIARPSNHQQLDTLSVGLRADHEGSLTTTSQAGRQQAKHRVINAETALSLAVQRLIVHLQRVNIAGRFDDLLTLLVLLEKMIEEHVDYQVKVGQLRSTSVRRTPLMFGPELHKFKKLLERVNDHLPVQLPPQSSRSGDDDHACNNVIMSSLQAMLTHLACIHGHLKMLNMSVTKEDDKIDYFLDTLQMTLNKLSMKIDAKCNGAAVPETCKQEQNIVYAASIRQIRLHSDVNDGALVYQGFLWKRQGALETRFWALLFNDVLLLTHVNNGVHFVEEEPVLLGNTARLLTAGNHLNPIFRLVQRPDGNRLGNRVSCFSYSIVTLRAKEWSQKVVWIQLIQRQIDELQSRQHCWNEASLCDSSAARMELGRNFLFRRMHRCLSSDAIPVGISALNQSLAASYQSYSCDDLYLATDEAVGNTIPANNRTDGNSCHQLLKPELQHTHYQQRVTGNEDFGQDDENGTEEAVTQTHGKLGGIKSSWANSTKSLLPASLFRYLQTCTNPNGEEVTAPEYREESDGDGVVRGSRAESLAPESRSNSVTHVARHTTQVGFTVHQFVSRLCSGWVHLGGVGNGHSKSSANASEIASATICPEEEADESDRGRSLNQIDTYSFPTVLETITEDDASIDCRMRQFQSALVTHADERHALHSTGDSTETSPSWASASSSAMQTPNDIDQPLAFDFGRKCELNPDLRKQLVLPSKTRPSYSMPTTPEMTESSPSPRNATTGIFRFPFVGQSTNSGTSPRRFRNRTMSAEGSGADEASASSSPGPIQSTSVDEHQTAAAPSSSSSAKTRFYHLLRRTHSASTDPEAVPAHALFLRTKRAVSKTQSADMAVSSNEVFGSSVDEAASAAVAYRKNRLSEMRLRLGFLRRRSTDSSMSARPPPEEAQKWTESFNALINSKYGLALYRAFLLREFSNENLEFWLACEDFKVSKPQKLAAKAQKIYNDFVAVQAPKEVNLDAETRLITLTNVQSNNPDVHTFDRAQRRIQHMMERDSYLRFLQSELFLELIHPERYPASTAAADAIAADQKSSAP